MTPPAEPPPGLPPSPFALTDELWEQFQQIVRELDQVVWDEAQARSRCAELQARLDRLQQLTADLQQTSRAAEKAAREARAEADALKVRLAYTEDIVAGLNQSLTWCQNYAWAAMTRLRDYLNTPHHRLGRAWQVLTRDKAATLKALASWLLHRATLRPYSLARALPAPYEAAEIRESLEILAFYAQNAKRQVSSLPVATPSSMAVPTLHAAKRPRPDLIVYSITRWDFRRQRPQHLVGRLVARGSRAFVMPTDLPGLGVEYPTDDRIRERMTVTMLADDIWEVTPCAFRDLNIYRDALTDPRDLAILRRSLALLRDRFGIARHVALVQLPFWGPLALDLPGARVVYDCMDHHRDFSTNDAAMLEHEDRLVAEADAVVVSSDFLDRAVGSRPRAKALIRNGCEYDYFAAPPELIDPALAALAGPVIGYYGAISDWFDAELVEAVARSRPDWNFVLIGHTFGAKLDGLKALPNVLFLGEVPYARLTAYLYRFDVCTIPFRLTELIKATNPVKIYEYSAAGKPTVATRIPEVERLGDLAAIADDAPQFERAIARALAEPDPATRAERLRAFARENTWDERADAFDAVLRRHLYPKVSAIVLSYKNWPLTRDCLASILEETTWPNLEVIVVDNGSDAETRAQLQALGDPRLKLQFNETNLGYAGGNNSGARLATGDILILLNNDTVCPPDWIERLLAPLAEDPRAGMAGPMTNSAGNEQMLDVFCQSNQDQRRWLQEFYRVRRGRRHQTDRLGFFCVAIRRETWDAIGELDAGFEVGFFEDDDYCARAREAGCKLVVAEDAFVYHHGSASFNKMERADRQAIEEKNRARFEAKHQRPWQPPICEYLYYGPDGPGDEARPIAVVAPGLDWNAPVARPQQVALALVRRGWRVYYLTGNQQHDGFLGIRLVSPFLYVAENRPEWLAEIAPKPVELLLSFNAEPPAASLQSLFPSARLVDLNPQSAIRNPQSAIDFGHLAREAQLAPPPALAPLLQSGAPPIGIYGRLDDGYDWAWLESLARLRRDWAFVFINAGEPPTAALPDFFNLRNAHLVPGRPYYHLPNLLAFIEAGLAPPGAEPASANEAALTMLAAGVPVVAAAALDLDFEGLVPVAETVEQAAAALQSALGRRHDAVFLRRCAEFAKNHDWTQVIAPLIESRPLSP